MSQVTALDLPMMDPLPERVEKYFGICEEKLGLVPNVLKAYAFDEGKLDAFSALYNDVMLAESGLSKLEREMIAVVVSSINKGFYCLVAHGQAVRELSGDPELGELLVMNWRAAGLDNRYQAMLSYAEKLTREPELITDDDRDALRAAGFEDKDIFDITDVASFFNYTNRMALGLDMMPNREYHKMNR